MMTKSSSESGWVFVVVSLLAVFVGGSAAGRLLDLPVSPSLVGLGAALLALRIGVMHAAVAEPATTPSPRERAAAHVHHAPALRAAKG